MDSMLHIKASKKQLAKLRNGHKVRVSPAVMGEGVNLIVHPQRYNLVSKTFMKGKGVELQLSPDELMVNRKVHSHMKGKGIFGDAFDNFVENTIGTQAKDIIYKGADELKPMLKQGINAVADYAPELGASALSGLALALGQPELVPVAGMVGSQLGKMAGDAGKKYGSDYLDNPRKYQGYSDSSGLVDRTAPKTLQGAVEHNEALQEMNRDLGTQYGNLARATLGNLEAHKRQAGIPMIRTQEYKSRPYITPEYMRTPTMDMPPPPPRRKKGKRGKGLYAGAGLRTGGEGLYVGRGLHKREVGSIGMGGGFVGAKHTLPPALQSQPFGSNFQFSKTLPPQYQRFADGGVYA